MFIDNKVLDSTYRIHSGFRSKGVYTIITMKITYDNYITNYVVFS